MKTRSIKQYMAATTLILLMGMGGNATAQEKFDLQTCIDMAQRNNIKMREAQMDINVAKAQQQEARAKYFPQVVANGTYFASPNYLIQQNIGAPKAVTDKLNAAVQFIGLDPKILANLPLSYNFETLKDGAFANVIAMEPIYAGGRITAGNKLADLQVEVKQLLMQQTADEVRKTTEAYYYQWLTLYEKQRTIERAQQQLKHIYEDANNAIDAGLITKNQLLTVEMKQNELELNRIKVQNGIAICRMVLAQYIGADSQTLEIDTQIDPLVQDPQSLWVDPLTASYQRTEAQLLQKNVEAQKLFTKMKRGEQLPTLAIGGTAFYQNITNRGQFNVVGLATLTIPISSWWGNKEVKKQQLELQKAKEEQQDKNQMIVIGIQNDYMSLQAAYQQIVLAEKTKAQAAENLKQQNDFFKAGTATMSELLDAQTKDQQAQDTWTEALVNYYQCRTKYLLSTARKL